MNRKVPPHFFWLIITHIPIVFFGIQFVSSGFFSDKDLFWVIGIFAGLFAYMLLWWQYILGVRPLATMLTKDLVELNYIHKQLGIYGILLIMIHPIILIIDFYSRGFDLLTPKFDTEYDIFIGFGKFAFILILIVWTTSALVRKNMKWRTWKRLHFLTYPILFLLFFHSIKNGTFFANKGLEIYWYILFSIFILITIYRFLFQLGILKSSYCIKEIKKITSNTTKITMQPKRRRLKPSNGQFIYIQTTRIGESHPFTVSHFDDNTNEISITVKASGNFSSKLQSLNINDIVFLDGPYGVFTNNLYKANKPIVIIAGGIGITPFLWFFEYFKLNSQKFDTVTLFYGNQTPEDIAYSNEITSLNHIKNFELIHVLSNTDNIPEGMEKGFITIEILKKYIGDDMDNYDFFVCGPPIMLEKVQDILISAGVEEKNIYTERFSL